MIQSNGELRMVVGIELAVSPAFLVIEGDNMLATNVSFLARVEAAGIVRARVPITLTSRADSVRTPHGLLSGSGFSMPNVRRPSAAPETT